MDALKSKGQMYDQIDLQKIPRSGFDLSYDCKGTGSLGRLYPIRCMNTLPGDRFQGSSQISVQFEPLAVPMLSNMHLRSETFYVPNRLLWQDWEKFISGGQQLDDTSVPPMITPKSYLQLFFGDLCDLLKMTTATEDWLSILNTKYLYTLVAEVKNGESFPLGQDDYDVSLPVTVDGVQYIRFYRGCVSFQPGALLERFRTIRLKYFEIAQNSDIYDLWLDSLSALDSLISYLSALNPSEYVSYDYNSEGQIMTEIKGFIPLFDVHVFYPTDFRGSTGDRNLDLIMPILSVMDFSAAGSPNRAYLLHEVHAQVLQYLYDFCRPFVGLGSNLDMLGYTPLKLVDMYASVYSVVYSTSAYWSSDTFAARNLPCYLLGQAFMDSFSTLPLQVDRLRALYAIWYNYYRDQVLESDAMEPCLDGSVVDAELWQLLAPRRRCWAKDTFTTALDNTGTGSVVVPVSDGVITPVKTRRVGGFSNFVQNTVDGATAKLEEIDTLSYTLTTGEKIELPSRYLTGGVIEQRAGNLTGSAFSLDVMKRAQRVQKWIQKALIYGNRPQDFLFTHFGVRSSDARLQIPEYICGDSQLCRLDTIINNTTTSESVAGDKAANAYGYTDGQSLNRFCEEHGIIITLFSVMPSSEYGYGVSRDLRRITKFDYPFPEFADLGMDGVMSYELVSCALNLRVNDYVQPSTNIVFGYQGRYYDQKCKQNEIHGDLQDTQDMYTFARKFNPYDFESMPRLNRYFVHCRPRLDMFVSDYPLADQFRFDVHHSQAVERCLPVPSQFL